jgi:hypothetical protein
MNIEQTIEANISNAIFQFYRFLGYYRLWFDFYFDPDSDEIVSDIENQAEEWAWAQI